MKLMGSAPHTTKVLLRQKSASFNIVEAQM